MSKRRHSETINVISVTKRVRLSNPDRLSALSDELLLRILTNLSTKDLNNCQHLSHKYSNLAADSQLWKAHYYNRFVRPRAARIRGIKDGSSTAEHLHFSSKVSKWLDEESLVRKGVATNWKRQYKLRHNWSKGSCNVGEICVADQPPAPPLLLRMHEGIVYGVNTENGLRAWSMKGTRKLLGSIDFPASATVGPNSPTAMAINTNDKDIETQRIAVGFEDGSYTIYAFDCKSNTFEVLFCHPSSSNGLISAIAYHAPYLATTTATHVLSVYNFHDSDESEVTESITTPRITDPPRLLHSLRAQSISAPYSLFIRPTSTHLNINMAYSIKSYFGGWTVGIQEIHLDPATDTITTSRTAISDSMRATFNPPTLQRSTYGRLWNSPLTAMFPGGIGFSRPSSLCYTHPYLLLGHPDNTLTLYMVNSTAEGLSISKGSRLWGHTSGVSGAHVEGRGKAVSISQSGDDIRIWELEGHLRQGASASTSHEGVDNAVTSRRAADAINHRSVKVIPEIAKTSTTASEPFSWYELSPKSTEGRYNPQSLSSLMMRDAYQGVQDEAAGRPPMDTFDTLNRGWVGFDEERVVTLREGLVGGTSLMVYDFS